MKDDVITAKRRRRSLSVRQKLYCISALGVAFQVIVAVVALLSLREVNSAAAATDRVVLAQRQLQDADMAHDALRGDVSAAVLAGDGATGLSLAGLADAVRVDAASMRDDIVRTAALGLNASVDAPVRELRRTADAYAEDATRIVDLAATDHDAAVARVRAFESSYATLSTGFAATREAIGAHAERAAGHAAQARFRARLTIVLASLAALLGMFVFAGMIGRSLVRKLDALADVAHRVMGGDREARYLVQREDEIGELGRAFNAMADDLTSVVAQLERDAQRDGFGTQLVEALEMADEEASAHEVIERAMVQIDDAAPTELLLSDSSRAHLSRAAESPTAGAAGCPVSSPFSCVAVRRGNPVVFDTSQALNACPKLRGRAQGACSAVCVPVTFMGRALGVLHATGPDGAPATAEQVAQLTTLATQAGARIGTVRAFEKTQLQASTDGLTGLINRRTLENRVRPMIQATEPFALAIADLDRFKQLNDTYGHEAGDRALRLFAEVLKRGTEEGDLVARQGGEEFVIVLPRKGVVDALRVLEGLRRSLADAVAAADIPVFTASFGLTDASQADTLEGLLRIADAGLYAAKQRGRDRVIVGDAKQAADIARAGQMAGAVADAVAQPRPAIHAAAEEDEPRPSGVEIR